MPVPALLCCLILALGTVRPAFAQISPSQAELRAYSGLHAAAAQGDSAAVERLVGAGEAIDSKDARNRTPLHVAVFRGRHAAARVLLRLRADPNAREAQDYDIVTIAAVQNDVEMLQIALAGGGDPKAVTSPYAGTALIAAAHLGHDEVVRTLIAAGAPLDHVNNLGWTALMEAVVLGDGGARHAACVAALVQAGANRDIPDRQGITALGHARQRGFTEIVRILETASAR